MGIGAFVYYRRVIENQKNRIFDKIISSLKKIGGHVELINELEAAKKEIQFSKAVESIKHSFPDSLLINQQNPLTLLHSALSQGLHEKSDSECLDISQSIRIVLVEFSIKLSQVLKESNELKKAVTKIINRNKT